MAKEVLGTVRVVVIAGKADVAISPNIDAKRVPRMDNDPDSDVEFAVHDYHWILDVFLDHPHPPSKLQIIIVGLLLMCKVVDLPHLGL